jgi:hypothetical protein
VLLEYSQQKPFAAGRFDIRIYLLAYYFMEQSTKKWNTKNSSRQIKNGEAIEKENDRYSALRNNWRLIS